MSDGTRVGRFNPKEWIQAQIGCLITAEVMTVGEARAAVEALADDDRFWGLVAPMMRAAEDLAAPIAAQLEADADTAARHKRGLA